MSKKKAGKKKDKSSKKKTSGKKDKSGKKVKAGKKSGKKSDARAKDTAGGKTAKTKGTVQAGPSIKDPEMYQALRDQGSSEEKAARISNAAAATSRSELGRKGGQAEDYTDRTKAELLDRARELDIAGRSTMNRDELIEALRNH
ncbi:MAG: hypothetical protein WAX29_00195 [Propionibacterium sp.]